MSATIETMERTMEEAVGNDELSAVLDVIASWLLAAYGARLERVAHSLEGYYGPMTECYGIVPLTLDRGVRPDGIPESRETLPTRQIRTQAERLLARLVPSIRCTGNPVRDVRHVASSSLVRASDVSAHRRIELVRIYGRISPGVANRSRSQHRG